MPQFLRLFLVAILSFSLCGCVHYMTIQQGVQLQQTQVDQLQAGMTQAQVEYILGTPNLIDPYHADTWYYIYTNQPSHEPMTKQKLSVTFKNGKLVKASGDFNINPSLK